MLYGLSEADRITVLKKIFADLKPGAKLALNDPRDFVQRDPVRLRQHLISVMTSAVDNHAPITEKEAAFIGVLNLQFLIGGNNHRFLSTQELQQLARAAGFTSDVPTYSTLITMLALCLVLTKPE